jgi:hypothetical protein
MLDIMVGVCSKGDARRCLQIAPDAETFGHHESHCHSARTHAMSQNYNDTYPGVQETNVTSNFQFVIQHIHEEEG